MPPLPEPRDELATTEFRQSVTAEWIATFMFIFCTIGCVVFTQDGGISSARELEVALVFGLTITILVFIFAGISGANINPAVSLALMLTRKISVLRCAAYTVAQCLGAVCGAGFIRIMTPRLFDRVNGGANTVNKGFFVQEALGVEFGCTFLLVMTVMAATDSVRAKANPHISVIAPIVIGFAVTIAHFVAIPVDNCSINPARSFGVSAISGFWKDQWVFWMGPYLGATAAALCYTYLLLPQTEEHPIPSKGQQLDDAPIQHPPVPVKALPRTEAQPIAITGGGGDDTWK